MTQVSYKVSPKLTVRETLEAIDQSGKKVALVVAEDEKLLGIFSDGDMRRYILKQGNLEANIREAMNPHPITFASHEEAVRCKTKERMVVYPIVDAQGKLLDALFWNDETGERVRSERLREVPVVIMAGGKGTRLYPYTRILPKPLIPIGEVTITERIIDHFRQYGSQDFYFILNYKGNMIKAYMNELGKDYNVYYKEETQYLGTAGGLTLLKEQLMGTFFVSNCDILIDTDYTCIYDYHKSQGNKITFVCALRNLTVPYGVATLGSQGEPIQLTEKPSYSFLANTGLYLLEPEVLEEIPEGQMVHLTQIIQEAIAKGEKVGVYPISEKSWLDMGQLEEMEEMIKQFNAEGK